VHFRSSKIIGTNLEQQIAKNLKEEIALYSADPGVIWNPANPQYLFRNGCR
jgi:hypothetical protein